MTAPPPIDVGILIALVDEWRVFFPLAGKPKGQKDPEFGVYTYRFEIACKSGQPYRCIALLANAKGPEQAIQATQCLIRAQPKTLVNLGIAAALHNDLRLTDVIVAEQVDAYLSTAKAVGDGTSGWAFERRGKVYSTTHSLANEPVSLEFAHPDAFDRWQSVCAEYTRTEFAPIAATVGERRSQIIRELPSIESVHLASGPVVSASEAFSRWIQEWDGQIKALEMEAAGMMLAAHQRVELSSTLVLRGISDFGDSRKSSLDAVGNGVFRKIAMHNATQLLWEMMHMGLLPRHDGGDTERVRNIVLDRLSTGFNLLFVFFLMMIETYCKGGPAYAGMMELITVPRERVLNPAEVDSVIGKIVDLFSDQPVFDPKSGTLNGLPKDKGVLYVAVERGIAPRPEQLPASFILLSGIQQIAGTCGTALATYGVNMGLELVEDVNRLYEHLHSAEMLVDVMCSDKEYLEAAGGRIKSKTFLGHMRKLLEYFVKYYKGPTSGSEPPDGMQTVGDDPDAERFSLTVGMGRPSIQASADRSQGSSEESMVAPASTVERAADVSAGVDVSSAPAQDAQIGAAGAPSDADATVDGAGVDAVPGAANAATDGATVDAVKRSGGSVA